MNQFPFIRVTLPPDRKQHTFRIGRRNTPQDPPARPGEPVCQAKRLTPADTRPSPAGR
jgi:hypothetical protein